MNMNTHGDMIDTDGAKQTSRSDHHAFTRVAAMSDSPNITFIIWGTI